MCSITPRNERQGAVAELCTFILIEALLLIGYNILVKGDTVIALCPGGLVISE